MVAKLQQVSLMISIFENFFQMMIEIIVITGDISLFYFFNFRTGNYSTNIEAKVNTRQ